MINLRRSKSLPRVTREWDTIAATRDEQVRSGRDHSANHVLAPAILKELQEVESLIDIGCGTGWLTARASTHSRMTVGIDPSKGSIAIGRDRHNTPNVYYYEQSVEEYAASVSKKFDFGISNMAASSAPDIQGFLLATRRILKRHATFVFTIPHPCFWPIYWGYASHPGFDYSRSYAVEGDFRIQNEQSQFLTTHFHHPLEHYMSCLASARFRIEAVRELLGRGFSLPRFLLLKVRAM
jgi:SAM-dependent methyltransferase